jgi:hypothetical protein
VRIPLRDGLELQHADLCAGWVTGGTIMRDVELGERPPVVTGPEAPTVSTADDPLAWHELGPLPSHGMRRWRRLDVWAEEDEIGFETFFRDTHADASGFETVVHEYTVTGAVDPATLRFTRCHAEVGALPWVECPAAAASAEDLVGTPLGDLRRRVRDTFVGPRTCTHLNDVLRSLQDVPALVDALPGR